MLVGQNWDFMHEEKRKKKKTTYFIYSNTDIFFYYTVATEDSLPTWNIKYKQTSTKNSGPGSLLMQRYFRKKCRGRNMKYHWAEGGSNPRRLRRQRLALQSQET